MTDLICYGRFRHEPVVPDDWVSVPHSASVDSSLTVGLTNREYASIMLARRAFMKMRTWVVVYPQYPWFVD
jgi:hypothetical protein